MAGIISSVRAFGAKGDGVSLDTVAIQAAVDAACRAGGGIVLLDDGSYLSGTIILRSGVELSLESGAILLGSTDYYQYTRHERWLALILASDCRNISISGSGTIDGQGKKLADNIDALFHAGKIKASYSNGRVEEFHRPQLIEMNRCSDISIQGTSMKNSACWVQNYRNCENLRIEGLKVDSTAYWNNDGIDIDDCVHVVVRNCTINSSDDGICLKSETNNGINDDILIEKCRIRSSASAIKFGTASRNGFRNVIIRDIDIRDTFRSAIAIECVDGGTIENIRVERISARNTGNAIFIKLGHRRKSVPPGKLSNIVIDGMEVEIPLTKPDAGYELEGPLPFDGPCNLIPSSITGIPEKHISGIVLKNIRIIFYGGGTRESAKRFNSGDAVVPECESDYPEYSMFGELPAWGLYCRHVDNISFERFSLCLQHSDYRPALVLDDCAGISMDRLSI